MPHLLGRLAERIRLFFRDGAAAADGTRPAGSGDP